MLLSKQAKILIIVSIVALTLLYSKKTKDFYEALTKTESPLLTKLPAFSYIDFHTSAETFPKYLMEASPGIYVHFWATWCAPCMSEFPELIKLAKNLEGNSVKFLLLAIEDKFPDVEKFVKRFSKLPTNITIGFAESKVMDLFGTSKVPETFLFGRDLSFIARFIGPQNWGDPYFLNQTKKSLKVK